MHTLFLLNPTAGKTDCTQQLPQQINAAAARAGLAPEEYTIRITTHAGHARELARAAAAGAQQAGEPLRIFTAGGDGTFNEALTGAYGFAGTAVGCGHIGQLLRPVGVEDLPALAVLLQLNLVFQLLAGQVLVHEALAVEVEVQEACIAHNAYAGEVGAALSAIAPTYYVTGNHEWGHGTKVVEEIKRTLCESGVTVLSNEFTYLARNGDTIVLAGIDDPNGYADQETPYELAQEVYAACGDPFWILLAHRNNRFARQYSLLGADLVCSGHAHGGIVRLPRTDGLFSHDPDLFPSYTAGLYEENGSVLFVTRGLGNSGPSFRVFNRPEIAVLTLRRAEG